MNAVARPAPAVNRLYYHPEARAVALPWQQRFELVEAPAPPPVSGFYLWAVNDHLELRHGGHDPARAPGVWITAAELARRAAQGGELARACGLGGGPPPRVLDVMAGWGVDGLVLSARGATVTLVERHPAVSALQQDLVRRSGLGAVTCRCGDGFEALEESACHDVVYLDPMFPERGKGALPGKRMQYLAVLCAPDHRPLTRWLEAAIAAAGRRVVLKRRRKDPQVAPPDWQIQGRTVRYDVFRGQGGSAAAPQNAGQSS